MSFDAAALFALEQGILDAVQLRLMASHGGEITRACVVPGAQLAWDDCECGQLTVHVRQAWPSQQFPMPVDLGVIKCAIPYWTVELAVTVLRCAPQGDDDHPPACDALSAAAIIQLDDMEIVQRGVACALDSTVYRFQQHAPVGPDGICVGSELGVLVAVPNCVDECA